MSFLDQNPSTMSLLKANICKQIVEGRPVNFKKELSEIADVINRQSPNTIADLEKLATPKLLGDIYLAALDEAIQEIQTQISVAIRAGRPLERERESVLRKNQEAARKRLRNVTDMLSDGGQFRFGGAATPFFLIYREETVQGQMAYSITDFETGDLTLLRTPTNILGTERGYLDR